MVSSWGRFFEIATSLRGHEAQVFCLAFSPDGRRSATGSLDKSIRLWDAEKGDLVLPLQAEGGPVFSIDFDPDGNTMDSGHDDGSCGCGITLQLSLEEGGPLE